MSSDKRPYRALLLLLLLAVLFAYPGTANAQEPHVHWSRLTVEDGLSQNAIFSMAQDHEGYMWFGTRNGLNRYDGHRTLVFRNDPDDPASLGDSFVTALLVDHEGTLWAATLGGGLNRWNPEAGTFTRYAFDLYETRSNYGVSALFEDPSGTLWVGTYGDGLARFNRATGTFSHFRHDPLNPYSLSQNAIWAIYQDRSGTLWVGTEGGLNRFDPASEIFTRFRYDPRDPRSLSSDYVFSIAEDGAGRLWIGTQGGLNLLDREMDSFTRFRYDPADQGSLSGNFIGPLLLDSQGDFWIGTQGGGLDRMVWEEDDAWPTFAHYRHDPADPRSLSSNIVRTLYEDRMGVLWVGTRGGGLSKWDRANQAFMHYQQQTGTSNTLSSNSVKAFAEAPDGSLWIATRDAGLNHWDRESGLWTRYRHDPGDPGSLSSDIVIGLLVDRQGRLWATTTDGLDRYDPAIDGFIHYKADPGNPNSLSFAAGSVLVEDRSGALWVGTDGAGLNRLDPATGTFTHFHHDPSNPSSLGHDVVLALFVDHTGALWVGTEGGGLNRWRPESQDFAVYLEREGDPNSLSQNVIMAINEDPSGTLWIATGNGLNRWDRESDAFTRYGVREGLADPALYGVLVDDSGHLWLSADNGLTRFEPGTGTFRTYDRGDGVQPGGFDHGAFFRSPRTGELFFGGAGGFTVFRPEEVRDNEHAPPVVITAFTRFNQIERSNLRPGEPLELSYRDNFFGFEFAALDFSAPEQNQYAYMLEGFDPDWIEVGNRNFASYTNLRGGHYTFRVRAANSDGVWNTEGVAIPIVIHPPLWDTWWFRAGAGAAIIGLLALAYRWRLFRINTQKQQLEREVARRTGELNALLDTSQKVASTLELQPLLQLILDQLQRVIGYSGASILTLDEEGTTLEVCAHHGPIPQEEALSLRMPLSLAGLNRRVIQERKLLIVPDVREPDNPLAREFQAMAGDQLDTTFGYVRAWMGAPLITREHVIGMISLDHGEAGHYTTRHADLVRTFANQVAIAIENARLFEEAQDKAALEERQKLARELHDSVSQALYGIALGARTIRAQLDRDPAQAVGPTEYVLNLAQAGMAEMRALIFELRPESLANEGLTAALAKQAEAMQARYNLQVETELGDEPEAPYATKEALYRIAQEAMHNTVKHARASRIELRLAGENGWLQLDICDDGRGFDPQGDYPGHLGLRSMRERAERLGGDLFVESAPGNGARLRARLPRG
jgi:signal transduction histidine kinase/ligand-binding sensor domain-containing protein